jgi:glycosyltransferase involved in cell wall biosynthesis
MSRILIDLTDLEAWSGLHGGTQRVVYGIAKNYYLNQKSSQQAAVFISYSQRKKAFYKTQFDSIYHRVEAIKAKSATSPKHQIPSTKQRLKYHLRPFVPEALREHEAVRRTINKTLKIAVHTAKALKANPTQFKIFPKNVLSERINFNKNDTVLILGKPWDNPDIQKTLTVEKQETGFKLVQVVYDLIICLQPQLHHPTLFKTYTQHMFEAVSASDIMLPISESSANDLREFCRRLNLALPTIKVIRLGDEITESVTAQTKPDERIQDIFIACVGTVEIRKNHTLLYYAYKLGLEQGLDLPQLIIVGGKGWLANDLQHLVKNDPAIKNKIIIINDIPDEGLGWIYGHCLFTVYPSMYEGWGLPVAESLTYGKLCIASNTSSIPEIAGDAIAYFSPYDPRELLDRITQYLNPETLSQKEADIKRNYRSTTWDETFHQVQRHIQ